MAFSKPFKLLKELCLLIVVFGEILQICSIKCDILGNNICFNASITLITINY